MAARKNGSVAITSEEFGDRNTALFERRTELRHQLDGAVETSVSGTPVDSRMVARLERLLDAVTTEIVHLNLGLVRSYCRRFTSTSSGDDSSDFEAAGMLGLMRAIHSFDPGQGRFGNWAFKPIQREVLRAVRDADHPNVTIGDFERRPEILRAQRHLQGDDGAYVPTHDEVANLAGVSVDQVRRVLTPPRFESVEQATSDDGRTSLAELVETDQIGPESAVVSSMALSALKEFGLSALDPRELYVLVRRFGLDGEPDEKLADIGETLSLSREAVRQIEARALAKIQHPMVLRRIQRQGRP
jgi:RNA polymerase primary sigma factor/RNA polymerase nonessential primary-like sigma factor